MSLQPVIKWSGSKRLLADSIIEYFPKEINHYYEPFCGGASILYNLLQRNDIKINNYTISDKNNDLIQLFLKIKNNPDDLINSYVYHWDELNKDEGIDRKKSYYTKIRSDFNISRCPNLFMFLLRTCYNGLTRYNLAGEFNTSFHIHRKGIHPEKLSRIINLWSSKLNENNVTIKCCDYRDYNIKSNDFIFLDPPYAMVSNTSMYNGGINVEEFNKYLKNIDCKFLMSYDDSEVSQFSFLNHYRLDGMNSSLRRLKGENKEVRESLYSNY